MSFSADIKTELVSVVPNARHCRIAELASLTVFMGEYADGCIRVASENKDIVLKYTGLVKKLLSLAKDESIVSSKNRPGKEIYRVSFDSKESEKLKELLKLKTDGEGVLLPGTVVFLQPCCKRAFLRGAFLAAGSVSDPKKDYHFEIYSDSAECGKVLEGILDSFDIQSKTIMRRQRYSTYVKDAEAIVDILNIVEAHVALMNLENIRILKEMRNSVNRRVNCEAANIGKTIEASGRQVEDIIYIRDSIGFEKLAQELAATAKLRLMYPDSSLKELGALHERPIGKSGVNHRLQKLSDIAERLREGKPL